jgi:hypothetical protein
MYQQLWGYRVEEKLYLGVREQKRLNTTDLGDKQHSRWWEQFGDIVTVRQHEQVLSLKFLYS